MSEIQSSIEEAPSGRAKCRGCGRAIAKGELRLGEHLPNPYSDKGPMSLWFHLPCGAYKRPEVMLHALSATAVETASIWSASAFTAGDASATTRGFTTWGATAWSWGA